MDGLLDEDLKEGKGEPPYTVMAKPMLVQLPVVKMWDLYGWEGLEIGWE